MATHGPVQNESDTPDTVSDIPDTVSDISDIFSDNIPDMNGH